MDNITWLIDIRGRVKNTTSEKVIFEKFVSGFKVVDSSFNDAVKEAHSFINDVTKGMKDGTFTLRVRRRVGK